MEEDRRAHLTLVVTVPRAIWWAVGFACVAFGVAVLTVADALGAYLAR